MRSLPLAGIHLQVMRNLAAMVSRPLSYSPPRAFSGVNLDFTLSRTLQA